MDALPFRRRRLAAAVSAALLVAALAAGVVELRSSAARAAAAPSAPPAMPVMVADVVQADVETWDEFSGRLEAVHRVEVRSRVAGAIQSVHFTEGALVKSGELLLTIDPAPYQAEVDRAQAQVLAARARLSYATSEQERAQRLWRESAIAQRELDERVNGLREAEANLRGAEAALQSARLNLGYTQVRAPVAGRVGKLEVTPGNLVGAGAQAPVLVTIVSVSPIYASFDADVQAVGHALADLPGAAAMRAASLARIPVEIETTATGDRTFKGHLQLVDNQVDARTGTVRVRAVFDNPDGSLMPGEFAHVRLGRARKEPAILINERAVGTDQSKRYVMVVGADNKVAYREVTLGPEVQGLRVVTHGLGPGERIVVDGLQRVRPGALVAPQPMKMADAATWRAE
ncbi:MAG TPA: efflux RND transporter periplasmic adaptor subunit [Usitatibacter sp.]|nr:efflux RND transporter periplasmic adaptor subunit [Usitatibacter sp.]